MAHGSGRQKCREGVSKTRFLFACIARLEDTRKSKVSAAMADGRFPERIGAGRQALLASSSETRTLEPEVLADDPEVAKGRVLDKQNKAG